MELRQVIEVMSTTSAGVDGQTTAMLAEAAEIYGSHDFRQAALALMEAADILPSGGLNEKIAQLHEAAELIEIGSRRMGDL